MLVVPQNDEDFTKVVHDGVVVAFEDVLEATVAREGLENDAAWRMEWAVRYPEAAGAWLLFAVGSDSFEEVPDLIGVVSSSGGRVAEDFKHRNPFHMAAMRGSPEMVEKLAASAVDDWLNAVKNMPDANGHTPLILALIRRRWDLVLALLRVGCSPGVVKRLGGQGRTLLHYAVIDGRGDAVRELVTTLGADLEAKSGSNQATPVVLAAQAKKWDVLELLLDLGANANARDGRGRSVLALAAASAPRSVLELLVAKGVRLEAKDAHGWTPLFQALGHCNTEGITALLEFGANPNVKDKYGYSGLDIVIRKHRWEALNILLNWEAIEWPQESLDLALGVSAQRGWWALVEELLDRGADPNAKIRGSKGLTALMYAASLGEYKACVKLINAGADVLAKNRRGARAVRIAEKKGHDKVKKLLRKEEYKYYLQREEQRTQEAFEKSSTVWERVSKYDN